MHVLFMHMLRSASYIYTLATHRDFSFEIAAFPGGLHRRNGFGIVASTLEAIMYM